jgi:hypothetical protein
VDGWVGGFHLMCSVGNHAVGSAWVFMASTGGWGVALTCVCKGGVDKLVSGIWVCTGNSGAEVLMQLVQQLGG